MRFVHARMAPHKLPGMETSGMTGYIIIAILVAYIIYCLCIPQRKIDQLGKRNKAKKEAEK
jgi:hypothetical protein